MASAVCLCQIGAAALGSSPKGVRPGVANHSAENHSTAPVMLTRERRETVYGSAEIRGMRLALTFGFGFLKSVEYFFTAGCRLDSFQASTLYFYCFKSESEPNYLSA